jgi:hypothetical protein
MQSGTEEQKSGGKQTSDDDEKIAGTGQRKAGSL